MGFTNGETAVFNAIAALDRICEERGLLPFDQEQRAHCFLTTDENPALALEWANEMIDDLDARVFNEGECSELRAAVALLATELA